MFSFIKRFREKKQNRERILALDLLRGTFLIEIICAHIAWRPSLTTFITGGDGLFASAAEGFFTISGLLVGYLYGPRILKDRNKTVKKIWKRALLLYCLATFFTLFYTAWAVLEPNSAVAHTIYDPSRAPWRFLFDTLTLRYAFGWAEFLNRYALFMLFAPLAVWLVAKGRAWVVAVISFSIWFFLRETDQFLPFSAWQLVFMFGIILGYYLPHMEDWFRSLPRTARRSLFISVVGVAAASYIFSMLLFVVGPLVLPASSPWVALHNQLIPMFDKNHLAPARVAVGILWFAALYMVFRTYEKPISKYTRGVLEVFGRQSLFVYTFHAFVLFILDIYFAPPVGHSLFDNTLITLIVTIVIYQAAYYRSHMTAIGKRLLKDRSTTPLS
jgi:hypothetical protein